ncbi:unnamed protein product [Symbiodinium microadriaticum]|nr:unnamed protein product [Symbiodinium microadriaticum]
MINRCKTKAALQEMMTENGLEFTKSQTVDQLRGTMLRFLMEHKVPAGASNYMGFGKHSSLTYGQVVTNFTSYTTWCVETAANESECHWRLRRFALWAQGLSRTEKEAMSKKTENELETTLTAWKTPRRAAAKAYHPRQAPSASSGEPTESKWELMSIQAESQDQEMIPETSSSSTTRLAEVEAELRELKELIKNQMKPETEMSMSEPLEADEEDLAPAECCSLSFKVAKGIGQAYEEAMMHQVQDLGLSGVKMIEVGGSQDSHLSRECEKVLGEGSVLRLSHWNGGDLGTREGQDYAFARAIWASNNRDQYSGYSPLQHAFGRSPNELGQLGESKLRDIPILTESGVSAEFGVDVKAMVTAEKAFLEEQAHARLRRAELSGARTMKHFCPGDLVYAWRRMTPKADGNKHFKGGRFVGPYRVLGTETRVEESGELRPSHVIWLYRGGQLVKAAPQQLRAATAREEAWNELNNQGVIPWTVSDTLKNNPPHQYEDISKDTEKGKEWTRDLGCFFVKQMRRQAVEISERHLTEAEKEGFKRAKQKEVKNFVVAKAFQALPENLKPSRSQILKMRWLLTWKLDENPEGEPLKRDTLGVPAQSTMLLTKAAYGLVEAPIQWFLTISRFLESIGGEQQFSDPCCWSFYKAEKDSQGHRVCIGHVCGHVDDFLFGGSSECSEWKAIKEKIQTRFKWGQWEVKKFTQCGVLIEQDDNGFALSQPDYLDAVSEIHVSRARWNDLEAPINATELHQLRSVLGALSWHATQVAPQWSAPVSLLLTKIHQGTVSDVIETNKLLRKAKAGQHQKLYIHKQESPPLLRWVNGDSQLANSLTKETELHQLFEYHRRKGQWRIVYDPELVSGRKRKQMGVDRLDLVAE